MVHIMPTIARKASKSSGNAGVTLTKTTEVGRLIIKFGGIALIILMVGRMVINGVTVLWNATHPEPPPPPTQGYGPLPVIDFGDTGSSIRPQSYVLELPGAFPQVPDRAVVYYQPQEHISLLSLEETQDLVGRLGFTTEPVSLGEQLYRWRKNGVLNASIEIDTVTKNLEYQTDYLSRPELQINNDLPTSFDAVQTVKQFLSSADLLPADLATATGETKFLKISGGTLQEAVSLSDAQAVRVNIFRTPLNGIASYAADGQTGLISATVASLNGKPTVIDLRRNYATLDYLTVHTYPLRSPQEAFEELKAGAGHIAAAQRSDVAIIRAVTLGYFESIDQLFLQPIYIFSGDNGFMGYAPALSKSAQTAQPAPPTPTPVPSRRPGINAL